MRRPVIAIVGRPNVGKSSLFNRLIGRRRALVRDTPGVTRDRLYGETTFGPWAATVIDTGGFDPLAEESLTVQIRRQIMEAIKEADLILFIVDAREGATPLDHAVARILRRSAKPVLLVANKVDGRSQLAELAELYELGFSEVYPVSAEHARGVAELLEVVERQLPSIEASPRETAPTTIAVVGRPNVGKSSLVNAILGEERVLVHEAPGTTRDAVDTEVEYGGSRYCLIDTAGIRRKGRVGESLEGLAVIAALKSLARAQVALVLLDAGEGVIAQDIRIAGYAVEAGRATILVVSKADLAVGRGRARAALERAIRERLVFLDYAPIVFTSAVTGQGIRDLFALIDRVAAEHAKRVPTPQINRVLASALDRRPPTPVGGRDLKVYYATQAGTAPPLFLLFVNDPKTLPPSYDRYLVRAIRAAFGFVGSPVRLSLRRRRAERVRARAS